MSENKIEETEKWKFLGEYLNRKMKNHGLPHGMAYYQLLSNNEEKAEKAWKRKQTKAKR